MAVQYEGHDIPLQVSADMSSSQFTFVKVGAADFKVAACGDGEKAVGILQDKPAADGRAGNVRISGTSKVVAGAAIALGAEVASDANGKCVTAASGDYILGVALEAAGAANQIIAVTFYSAGAKKA